MAIFAKLSHPLVFTTPIEGFPRNFVVGFEKKTE